MLAVFCDFDGTLMREEMGWSLAQQAAPDRVALHHRRYLARNLTSWEFTRAVFDGIEIGLDRIEARVQTATLDPGARSLLAWCTQRAVPFQVLSDGFDLYIEAVQQHYGLSFAFRSNHARIETGQWQVTPGGRQPVRCSCGTGLCKATCIRAFRAETGPRQVAYIGNAPISDACASTEADLVFAKDGLAEYLDREGRAFVRFETLDDVVAELERRWEED